MRTGAGPAGRLDVARDRALARRMRRGDEQAIRQFCQAYLPRLYAFAVQRTRSPADADDVVQVVLSTAARRIGTFRGDASLYAWLLSICRRELGRYSVRQQRTDAREMVLEDVDAPAELGPEAVASGLQQAARIRATLGRLPERYAWALRLKYMEGFSSLEIARQLHTSDEAVQSLLARARRAFREVCDDELREDMERRNGA